MLEKQQQKNGNFYFYYYCNDCKLTIKENVIEEFIQNFINDIVEYDSVVNQRLSKGTNVDAGDINVNLVYTVEEENSVPSKVFFKVQSSNQNLVLVKFDDDLNLIFNI